MKRTNAAPARKQARTTTRATPKPPKEEKTAENTAPKTMREADAVDLLTDDHLEVHALFKQYEKLAKKEAPADQRQALAQTICDMLKAHTTIEEEIFYPAARRAGIEADLLDEADIEHASAKDLIAQIEAATPTTTTTTPRSRCSANTSPTTSSRSTPRCSRSAGAPAWTWSACAARWKRARCRSCPRETIKRSGSDAMDDGKGKSTGILASLFSKA